MTEKTLTTENIKPAIDALRGELAPWPVVAMKQDRLNDTQKSAVNSGITSSLVAQIIANTAAIRALESAITGTGLRALVVSSLPAVGTLGILYIVPVTTYDPETDADVVNYSNEYIWIVAPDAPVTEGYYEQVGQTGIVINNGQLTITVNGTSVGTFTANQSGDTTAAITVPTNADYVDKTTAQTAAGVKTFSDGIVSNVTGNVTGDLTGTASKAIADEDGTSIKTGYGKLAGNQTWTGENQWGTNLLTVKDSAFTKGTTVTDRKQNLCKFTDSNDSVFGIWEAIQYTSGRQGIRLNLTNRYKNGALDPTGNDVPVYFEFLQKASDGQTIFKWANGLIDNGIYPVGSYSLGNNSYQWSSVYAQSYYYNGTEFSSKFVTTDTEQTITSIKTISRYNARINLNNTSITRGVIPSSNTTSQYYFGDSTGAELGRLMYRALSDGTRQLWIAINDNYANGTLDPTGTNKWNNLFINIDSTGHKSIMFDTDDVAPNTNNATNLGTSTNKWKTFNGINPGALSLPNYDQCVDKTSEIPVASLDGNTEIDINDYFPNLTGWINIVISDTSGNFIRAVQGKAGTAIGFNNSRSFHAGSTGGGFITLFMPIVAGSWKSMKIQASSVTQFRFYPCLGNV